MFDAGVFPQPGRARSWRVVFEHGANTGCEDNGPEGLSGVLLIP
jgi:hypothetical protein